MILLAVSLSSVFASCYVVRHAHADVLRGWTDLPKKIFVVGKHNLWKGRRESLALARDWVLYMCIYNLYSVIRDSTQ